MLVVSSAYYAVEILNKSVKQQREYIYNSFPIIVQYIYKYNKMSKMVEKHQIVCYNE